MHRRMIYAGLAGFLAVPLLMLFAYAIRSVGRIVVKPEPPLTFQVMTRKDIQDERERLTKGLPASQASEFKTAVDVLLAIAEREKRSPVMQFRGKTAAQVVEEYNGLDELTRKHWLNFLPRAEDDPREPETNAPSAGMARLMAQKCAELSIDESVRHTVEFPMFQQEPPTQTLGDGGEPEWDVQGMMKLTNAFGASIQHRYHVTLQTVPDGAGDYDYVPVFIQIGDKVVLAAEPQR